MIRTSSLEAPPHDKTQGLQQHTPPQRIQSRRILMDKICEITLNSFSKQIQFLTRKIAKIIVDWKYSSEFYSKFEAFWIYRALLRWSNLINASLLVKSNLSLSDLLKNLFDQLLGPKSSSKHNSKPGYQCDCLSRNTFLRFNKFFHEAHTGQ